MKQLFTRSITGLVYVALIVGSLLFAPTVSFPLLAIVLALFAINEFHNLFTPGRNFCATDVTDIAGVVMFIAPLTLCPGKSVMMSLSFGLIWFVVRSALQLRAKAPAVTVFLTSMAGAVYIVAPLFILSFMTSMGMAKAVLALFIMLWLNDTGAYCVGSLMGRHRLCERLSPKKSWEGFWGGMLFTAAGGALMTPWFMGGATWIFGAVAGIIISIAATWGDLVESMLKRSQGVKDAGHILPGHGGILDRIDSLLIAAPVFAVMELIYYFSHLYSC